MATDMSLKQSLCVVSQFGCLSEQDGRSAGEAEFLLCAGICWRSISGCMGRWTAHPQEFPVLICGGSGSCGLCIQPHRLLEYSMIINPFQSF